MNTAQRIVARSTRPAAIVSWSQYAVAFHAGKRCPRGVVRFPDGSAIAFTPDGLPVEYIG